MVSVGTFPRVSTVMTQFLVVDCPSAFNAVLGRSTLRELRAVTSIYHLTMKFPTQHGVGEHLFLSGVSYLVLIQFLPFQPLSPSSEENEQFRIKIFNTQTV
ncbi:hypothetical protein PanWU01x14_230980 [Parasponia andersonii]|uniref:Uncharacterized protein n=1 Tax=Parasponia andersonii TaxID=3476 RepID=A0A2P5BKM9_PARAD|nr:hypothetical protein PanWU01x14_230980 [Parasponia andersonii]